MSQKDKKKSFSPMNNGGGKSPNNNNGGGFKQQQQSPKSPHNTNNNNNNRSSGEDTDLKKMKDRSLYMAMCLVGYQVTVTLRNGHVYEGLLHSASTTTGTGWGIVLKMARKRETPPPQIITTQPLPVLVIESKDFLGLTANGVIFSHLSSYQQGHGRGVEGTFQSDVDISGHDGVIRERELTPWVSDTHLDESLEAAKANNPSSNWDQFDVNEKLFGVKTSYNEDLYTTTLDRQSDSYKNRLKDVERLAYEIENKQSNNLHLQEERGHVKGTDYDEEERYSSVVRQDKPKSSSTSSSSTSSTTTTSNLSSSAGVYIPPHKRNQTSTTTTTTSAPVTPLSQSTKSTSSNSLKEDVKQKESTTTTSNTTTINSNATSSTQSSSTTPSKEQQQQTFKESASNSSNSLKNSSNGTNNDNSPVTKLRFPVRERTNSIDHSEGGISSPRDGQSPRTMASYSKLRAAIISEKLRNEPRSPLFSPLVSDPVGLSALSLTTSKPQVSEDTLKEFNDFKLLTKGNEIDRKQHTESLKSFSHNLNISRSRPSSPLIGPNSPRPNNISALSLGSPRPESSPIKADDKKDQLDSTSATSNESKDSKETKESSTSSSSSSLSSSKLKLNPNAKAFTPGLSANAPVFTPKGLGGLKPTAPLASSGSSIDFGMSGEVGRGSLTDSTTPINEMYYESMKKRQSNPEHPDTVSKQWSDVPLPYRTYGGGEDEQQQQQQQQQAYAVPTGGAFMRPPMMGMGVVPMPPYHYPSPPPPLVGPPPQMKSKMAQYNGQPPRSYAPQVVGAPNAMGQPPPPQYGMPYQPQFQYAVPPQMYNAPPPPPSHMQKRFYPPHQNTYPPPGTHMNYPPPGSIPPQNSSQSPSPQHQSPQIPSPTSPTHNRMVPSPQIINTGMYPPPPYQSPQPGYMPPRGPPAYHDPNQGYPPN